MIYLYTMKDIFDEVKNFESKYGVKVERIKDSQAILIQNEVKIILE